MHRILILLCWLTSMAEAQTVSPGQPYYPKVETFTAPDKSLSWEKVSEQADFRAGASVLGFEDQAFWVRFVLVNPNPMPQSFVLEDQWSLTDEIEIFVTSERQLTQHIQLGHRSPDPNELRKFHRYPYTEILLAPGAHEIYVRYVSNDVTGSRLALWHPRDFEYYKLRSSLVYALMLGAILVMSLYNFFLFLSLKNKAYFYYACYSFFFFAFQLSFSGFLAQLTNTYTWTLDEATVQFASLTMLGVILFSGTFLQLPQYAPAIYRIGRGLIALSLSAFCLSFVHFQTAALVTIASNLLVATWVLIVASVAIYHRVPEGKFYLFAWSFFVIGDYFTVMYYLGFAEPGPLNQWGMLAGSTIEVTLLSFGLARYINRMKREVAEAREALNLELANKLNLIKEQERIRTLFFQNTSHELRTPLNGIIGFLNLVIADQYGKIEAEAKLKLVKAHRLAEGLKHQVNVILDLAKSRQGKLVLEFSSISLTELRQLMDSLAEGLLLDSPLLSYSSEVRGPAVRCVGDFAKIETILRNLIGNAFKFRDSTRANHVSISLEVIEAELIIIVSDTGIGIAPENQAKIFDEFIQIEQDARRRFEGTGLGLKMVKDLVELMQGRIELQSQLGQASCFRLTIPVTAVESSQQLTANQTISSHNQALKTLHTPSSLPALPRDSQDFHILVVDDNPINCELIHDLLQADGYAVQISLSAKEALTLIQKDKPDLILLDMMMPEISGEDLLRLIRGDDQLQDIPVILVTARASDEDRLQGLALGADDYLPKPIFATELRLRVNNILQRNRMLKEIERSQRDAKMIQLGEMFHDLSHEIKNILQGSFSVLPLRLQDALFALMPCSFHEDLQKRLGQSLLEAGKAFRERSQNLSSLIPIAEEDPNRNLKRQLRMHLFDSSLSEADLTDLWRAVQLIDETELAYLEAQLRVYVQHQILMHTLGRCHELTQSILSYTRETHSQTSASLTQSWQDTMVLLKARYRKLPIRWQINLGNYELIIPPDQLTQVLVNFVLNALDAIKNLPPEQQWIRVDAQEREQQLVLTLANGGPPVPEEIHARLFERGFSTKGKDGSGIGLFVSRRILRAAEGQMSYDPSLPYPAFIITLPLLKSLAKTA